MKNIFIFLVLFTLFFSCKVKEQVKPTAPQTMYFPAGATTTWETTSPSALAWNQANIDPLNTFLTRTNTKAFIVLVNGRIVMEQYYNGHNATTAWEWNSAGKTLASASIGIAQQEGLLNITDKVSAHLGTGWTSMPLAKENLITLKHLLSMTAGNDDSKQVISKANLTYLADAGNRWAYSNIFQKLYDVIGASSKTTFQNYFDQKLKNKIGMDGYWDTGGVFTIYHSTARSMARYGLLALNKGRWNNEQVLNEAYFTESINPSQTINASYGYLWWLNGKASFIIPGYQAVNKGSLVPAAPADMYAAMGASDQRIYVVPSQKLVVVRMGKAANPADPNFAISAFDQDLWLQLNKIISN
jgi:CubicO group peptidase (beta-lactamase class C family)